MKNILLVIVLLASTQAFATKARMSALNYAAHVDDEQRLFYDVTTINRIGNLVAFESGSSTATSTADANSNAEGTVVMKMNAQDTMGLSLGHQDGATLIPRSFINTLGTTYNQAQNPVHVFYGHKGDNTNYSMGLFYSNSDDKVAGLTESSSGIDLGLEMGAWRYYMTYVLVNSVETATTKFDGSGFLAANVHYVADGARYYFNFVKTPAKSTTGITDNESHFVQIATLGLIEETTKDGNNFFWGVDLVSVKVDCRVIGSVACDKSFNSTTLPVNFGVEAQALPWLTLRGSIEQTVLVNQSKDEVGYSGGYFTGTNGALSEVSAGANTTTVAAGAGLNFKNVSIDGTLAAATSQQLNGTSLLSQVGLKYNF